MGDEKVAAAFHGLKEVDRTINHLRAVAEARHAQEQIGPVVEEIHELNAQLKASGKPLQPHHHDSPLYEMFPTKPVIDRELKAARRKKNKAARRNRKHRK